MRQSDLNREQIFNERIGEQIRIQRTLASVSQEDVALKLGVTRRQMMKYELGRSAVPTFRLLRIAALLKVNLGSLVSPAVQNRVHVPNLGTRQSENSVMVDNGTENIISEPVAGKTGEHYDSGQ